MSKIKKYRPGSGWKKLAVNVWKKGDTRVHALGTIRIGGQFVFRDSGYIQGLERLIRINGGNKIRGAYGLCQYPILTFRLVVVNMCSSLVEDQV